jgi:hypothetical protein
MANIWAIASGNWSNAAIWNGGVIPTASDDVFANNQIIDIDTNISVRSLQNGLTGSAVAGGYYAVSSSIAITASVGIQTGTTVGSIITNGMVQVVTTGSVTISGSITRPTNSGALVLTNNNTGTITILGNIQGPGQNLFNTAAVINRSLGNITVIGTLRGGSTSGNHAIQNSSAGSILVIGDVYGGDTGGSTTNGIYNFSAGTVTVTGNVYAGPVISTFYGINNFSSGIVTVTGNVFASGSTAGIFSTTGGTINVIGSLNATTTANAIQSTSTTATNIFSGPFINSGSRNAIYCYNVQMYDNVTTRYEIGVSGSNNTIVLYSPNQVTGVPSGSDVRTGIIYGPNNDLTGSMAVPSAQSVAVGVLIDNTTGSAITKPEDLWNHPLTSLPISNSIGQRLSNSATVQSTSATISSFTV